MVRSAVAEPDPGDMPGTTQAFSSVFRYPPIAFRRVGRPAGGFRLTGDQNYSRRPGMSNRQKRI